MKVRTASAVIALAAASVLIAPAAALAQSSESAMIQQRNEVREMAHDALATLYEVSPGARYVIEHAAGYAVFSTFGIKILFAGGTTGKGIVIDNRTHRHTFMKMLKVQAGLGFGIAKDRLIFAFETQSSMRTFINQGWEFGGQANVSAVVAEKGGTFAGAVSVLPGVYLYQLTDTGLAAQLTLSGTKVFKDDDLN